MRRSTFSVLGSIQATPVAESHCSESCLVVPAVAIAELTAAVVAYEDKSMVTFTASEPVKVEKRALGKNSRHLT